MTSATTDIATHARDLLRHRMQGMPIPLAGRPPLDIERGYATQDEADYILRTERGFELIGYKVAAANPIARSRLNLTEPFHGRMYRQMASASPAILPCPAGFFQAYEPEIAIRIGRDLDPASAPFTAAVIESATDAVLPAIELVGTWYTPWTEAGAANLIADNAAFGHWIMGEAVTDWSALDLLDAPVSLSIDGTVVATGTGRAVDGGAFGAAAWLANALARRGRVLRAGEYITTGSVTAPHPVGIGQHAIADFGRLGTISLTMKAG
ncbi:MAG: hypothetical protein U1E70_18835 [Acetobacteraceae bacterium]